MCFTVLISSWLIFHGTQMVTAAAVLSNASRVDSVTLVFHTKSGEAGGGRGRGGGAAAAASTAEIQRTLHAVHRLLRSAAVGGLPVCSEAVSAPCLATTKCPTEMLGNGADGTNEPSSQCSILMFLTGKQQDEFQNVSDTDKPSPTEVWGYGLLSVGIISLSGLFGGLLWPLMSSKYYDQAMRALIGLAVGTLTATSTMQLLPQGFGLKETDVETYLKTSIIILISLWSLYIFELSCKVFFYMDDKKENQTELKAPNSYPVNTDITSEKVLEQDGLLPTIVRDSTNRKPSLKPNFSSNHSLNIPIPKEQISTRKVSHDHIMMGGMAPVAWMVILGDGLHNFIDGMSIGAGFTHSIATGLSISIAIACEEFPHELGDFAILVNSGMPIKKALMYNFLSALTAVAGLVLGILLGELEASTYIFAFSGGLFLYISLTDLMPELNRMVEDGLKKSKQDALLIILQQNCGILFGFCLLYFISANPVTVY